MSFMDSYKHLDNLCKDIYQSANNGVSGYIEDMEHNAYDYCNINGWQDDYEKLKHYRWVRNKIAHEEDANEENMCEPGDVEWLDNFCDRIMNQTDPLAQLHHINSVKNDNQPSYQNNPYSEGGFFNTNPKHKNSGAGCLTSVIISVIAILLTGLAVSALLF